MNAATVLLVKVPQAQRLLVTAGGRQGPPGPTVPLGNLTDVDTAGAVQGQALAYDPASGGEPWKPKTITELLPLGAPGGIATLDGNGFIPIAQMPAVAINDTFPVNSQAEMLALAAQRGDTAIRLDTGQTFILAADDPTVLANWKLIVATAAGGAGGVLSGSYPNPGFAGSPSFTSDVPTNPILRLLAQPAQSGNFLEARDSLNNTVASISSIGAGSFASGTTVGGSPVVVTTDPRLSDTRPPTGPAGGVLAGTYPNPAFAPSPTFTPSSTTTAGLIVQGLTSQTADLQQWRNSAGTILGRAAADGGVYGGYFQSQSGASYMLWSQNPNALLVATSAGYNPLAVRGAASQTGDLTQWQNSAASVLSRVAANGDFGLGIATGTTGTPRLAVSPSGVNGIGIVTRGLSGQTGDLQQWQDSTSALLGTFSSAGNLQAAGFIQAGGVGAGRAYIGDSVSPTSFLSAGAPARIAVVVKGAASQAADLQQWQDSTGTAQASVSAGGRLRTTSLIERVNGSGAYISFAQSSSSIAIMPRAVSDVPLIIQGVASQTGDLQQWLNSSGSILANVDSAGDLGVNAKLTVGGFTPIPAARQTIYTSSATAYGLLIRGAASQTFDLQQWQDSAGNILASITAAGALTIPDPSGTGGHRIGGAAANSTELTVDTRFASFVGLVVRGRAAQTSDLQEWQDSSGVVLSRIRPNGTIVGLTNVSGALAIEASPQHAAALGLAVTAFNGQTADLTRWRDVNGNILTRVLAAGGIQSFGVTHTFDALAVPTGVAAGAPVAGGAFAAGTYYWIVTATNAAGETIRSAEVSAVVALNQQVTITWSQVTGATGYKVYRSAVSGTYTTPALVATITNGTTTSFIDTGAAPAAGAPPTSPGGSRLTIKQWANQAGNMLELLDPSNNVLSRFAGNGTLVVGGGGSTLASITAYPIASAGVGLAVRGFAGQSADLQQWQNSTATTILAVAPDGSLYNGASSSRMQANYDTGAWGIRTNGDANKGLVIRRNSATQTANLFEIQNESGVALLTFVPGGGFRLGNGAMSIGTFSTPGAGLQINTAGVGAVGLIVQGAAAQSADIQEWTNSASAILARVGSDGIIYSLGHSTLNARAYVYEDGGGGALRITKTTAAVVTPSAGRLTMYVRDSATPGQLALVAVGPGGVEKIIADNIA